VFFLTKALTIRASGSVHRFKLHDRIQYGHSTRGVNPMLCPGIALNTWQ
jgi:hypothetical protein